VLIVVGGPQYRVGSHRQFVLLARHLAEQGIPSMRFDYRGMGDSSGGIRDFEQVEGDIRSAVDRFFDAMPDLTEVVLWGLCDAATASVFYAASDRRVTGLVLLNPWVRTEEGQAKAYLKHYYLKRVIDPSFWKKAISGAIDVKAAIGSLAENVRRVARGRQADSRAGVGTTEPVQAHAGGALPDRMASALERFHGRVLLILSGNDLTAKEFMDAVSTSNRWRKLLSDSRVDRVDLKEANHTFSSRVWRDQVAEHTRAWVVARA
jgi:exosortase A-associated hydrolase 1